MNRSVKNSIKANGELITELRRNLNLTQKDLIKRASAAGIKINLSLRSLQTAEAKGLVSFDTLINISLLFNLIGAKHPRSGEDITIYSLGEGLNPYNYKKKEIDAINKLLDGKKKDIKKFSETIKIYKTSKLESTYLYKITDFHKLNEIIKKSEFRKIFYPESPKHLEKMSMQRTLKEIKEIYLSLKDINKKKIKDTARYEDLDKEIESLSNLSETAQILKDLQNSGLNLYAGNFIFNEIFPIAKETIQPNYYEADGEIFEEYVGNFTAGIKKTNYAIFKFSRSNDYSITFKYQNEWHKDKLEKIINIDPYKMNGDRSEVIRETINYYEEKYGYYSDIIKEKCNLVKTEIFDLLTEEEIETVARVYGEKMMEDYSDLP